MRIAGGIILWLCGILVFFTVGDLLVMFGGEMKYLIGFFGLLTLFIIWSGGLGTFYKEYYWLSLLGAVCSVLIAIAFTTITILTSHVPFLPQFSMIEASLFGSAFILLAIMASIFIVKSKIEFD